MMPCQWDGEIPSKDELKYKLCNMKSIPGNANPKNNPIRCYPQRAIIETKHKKLTAISIIMCSKVNLIIV